MDYIQSSPNQNNDKFQIFTQNTFDTISYTNILQKNEINYERTLILLHGAKGSAQKYAELIVNGQIKLPQKTKIVIIQSKIIHKHKTPWYRVNKQLDIDDDNRNNIQDIVFSQELIINFIDHEASLLNNNYKKIFLAGQSQGAVLAFQIQLIGFRQSLGGIWMFAGYVVKPLYDSLQLSYEELDGLYNLKEKKQQLNIYIWHGSKDTHFPYQRAFDRYDQVLQKYNFKDNVKLQYLQPGLGHDTINTKNKEGLNRLMQLLSQI